MIVANVRLSVSGEVERYVVGEVDSEDRTSVGMGGKGPEGDEAGVGIGREAFRALGEPDFDVSRCEGERDGGFKCVLVGLCEDAKVCVFGDRGGVRGDLDMSLEFGVAAVLGVVVLNEDDEVAVSG